MNKYVNQMKQAVLDYQGTARRIADQQAQNRETLVEALASAENTTLALELQEAEAKAQKQIQAVLDIVSGGLGKAVPLSGKDVTEDVQLLSGAFDLSREQLQELVEKHRNNPTMLNAIMKYTQNHGIHGVQVPTASEKLEAYKVFANGAWGMLRMTPQTPTLKSPVLIPGAKSPHPASGLCPLLAPATKSKTIRPARINPAGLLWIKLTRLNQEYARFNKAMGFKSRAERLEVVGWKKTFKRPKAPTSGETSLSRG